MSPAAFAICRPAAKRGSVRVDELSADQVEVAVAVEVGDAGIRGAVDVDRPAARLDLAAVDVPLGRILDEIDVAVQRTARPASRRIVGVVPAVVVPRIDADQDVPAAVAVPVDVVPHVAARLAVSRPQHLARVVDPALARIRGRQEEVEVLRIAGEDAGLAPDFGHADVVEPLFTDPDRGGEKRTAGRADVPEEPEPLVRRIGTRDEQVDHAVAVVVDRQRDAPQSDAQVHRQSRIVVTQRHRIGQFAAAVRPGREDVRRRQAAHQAEEQQFHSEISIHHTAG